jgi:hypothetical protein
MDCQLGVPLTGAGWWDVVTPEWHWPCSGQTGPPNLSCGGHQNSYSWRVLKWYDSLAWHDFNFIWQFWDNVMSLPSMDKQVWLCGIQLARHSCVTAPPAHQQQLMVEFFQTADDWFHLNFSFPSYIPSIAHWILSFAWLWWWHPHTVNCGLIKWVVVLWVAPLSFYVFTPSVSTSESYWFWI